MDIGHDVYHYCLKHIKNQLEARMQRIRERKEDSLKEKQAAAALLERPLAFSLGLDRRRGMFDSELFLVIYALLGAGLIICFSSYYQFSSQKFNADLGLYYFIGRQALWGLLGFGAMLLLAFVKVELFYAITPALWLFTVILNIIPAFGVFSSIRGGMRWIDLGPVSFQPSELAKLTLALYLARVLYRKEQHLDKDWNSAAKPAVMTAAMCAPIYFQNDLSTTVFIFGMSIVLFFLGGVAIRYIVAETLITLAVLISTILFTSFRMERILTWFNPASSAIHGVGRQPAMARQAIESAGLFGKGLGAGEYKLGRISLVQSDYVFATVVEELGLLGAACFIGLFIALALKGRQISLRSPRRYEGILAISLVLLICGQAFLNIGVVSGILPVTGVPLPFFSAGGTSLFVTLCMCGILLNLSRQRGSL